MMNFSTNMAQSVIKEAVHDYMRVVNEEIEVYDGRVRRISSEIDDVRNYFFKYNKSLEITESFIEWVSI